MDCTCGAGGPATTASGSIGGCGPPRVQRSRLGSTRSLSRQRRIKSVEDIHQELNERSSASSAQSIPEMSHASSGISSSPIGDYETPTQTSVLQKAAWFLQSRQTDEETKKLRLLSMGRTLQRHGSQFRKTRLYHIFYVLVLPIYTVIGALLFQWLDGEHDDRLIAEYKTRCHLDRDATLARIADSCEGITCFNEMKAYLNEVEECYRRWHAINRTVTHSMNDFTNAVVYAFSVYTTIGYGNMAADTMYCRMMTIVYGAFGIPLFFAFVKEAGNLFRTIFIGGYNKISAFNKKHCCKRKSEEELCEDEETASMSRKDSSHSNIENGNGVVGTTHRPVILISESDQTKRARFQRKQSANSLGFSAKMMVAETWRVFWAGVILFFIYMLAVSFLFSITTEFDFVTSVYFLFNSVALIGFGDVFPTDPKIILMNIVFIVIGVVLFSMCYFILQEEIRNKAFEASRRARKSISKYSHTIMQHAARSPWSRRNSPLLENNSPETAFERMRKRRQSAPAVTLTVPPTFPHRREI